MFAQIPALIQRAVQHFQQGELTQATRLLRQVLDAQPRNFDALHILGVIQAMGGHRSEAIELFRKALSVNKNNNFLQFNLAKALSESGRDEESLPHHRRATQLAPHHAEAWLNFGKSLIHLKKLEEALETLDRALVIAPEYAEAWTNRGLALTELARYTEALSSLDRALDLNPNLAAAYYNKALALDEVGQSDQALAMYERAIDLQPDYAQAWNNRGEILARRGLLKQALENYEKAVSFRPDYPDAHWNQSHPLMSLGRYEAAWEKFEYRWRATGLKLRRIETAKPLWQGTPSLEPVLLWGEQGIGDQILYASILPELADFPQRKMVALDKRLLPLFERSLPGFEFVDLEQVGDGMDFAEQLPLGSLPRHFRRASESFAAARHPYLTASPPRVARLRQQIAQSDRRVCGVSWSSNRENIGKQKSISLTQMLGPLGGAKLHFVDLQYGDTSGERQALEQTHGIEVQHLDELDNFHDIDGLAALIQACDVVITTSNSTAHLAGALGKETLLLLPLGKGKLWYWTEVEGKNPWYPSVRSFSQTAPGDWQQPLEQVKRYLEDKSWN